MRLDDECKNAILGSRRVSQSDAVKLKRDQNENKFNTNIKQIGGNNGSGTLKRSTSQKTAHHIKYPPETEIFSNI